MEINLKLNGRKIMASVEADTVLLDFLREKRVLFVPGSGFNWKQPDHFRLVYLPRIEVLSEATTKLAQFLDGYKQK